MVLDQKPWLLPSILNKLLSAAGTIVEPKMSQGCVGGVAVAIGKEGQAGFPAEL